MDVFLAPSPVKDVHKALKGQGTDLKFEELCKILPYYLENPDGSVAYHPLSIPSFVGL